MSNVCTAFTFEQFKELLAAIQPQQQLSSGKPSSQFHPEDLGYVDMENQAGKFMKTIDNKSIYHNVYSFIVRLRAKCLGIAEGPCNVTLVASQLDQCLEGKAEL